MTHEADRPCPRFLGDGAGRTGRPTTRAGATRWWRPRTRASRSRSPANRHKVVPLSFEEWKYAFTNTFTDDEARALYERYAVPANGGILWGSVLANFQPGHQDT